MNWLLIATLIRGLATLMRITAVAILAVYALKGMGIIEFNS